MPAFEWAKRDVSQAFKVQFEHTKVERLFHQLDGLIREMLFVAHKGEDHSDGQAVIQSQPGGEIDRYNGFQPKQNFVDRCERYSGATEANIGADHIGIAVEPLGLAVTFPVEDL